MSTSAAPVSLAVPALFEPRQEDYAAFAALFAQSCRIGATAAGGLHRLAASVDDGRARTMLCDWLRQHAFEVRVDPVGNIFGLMTFDPAAPYVLCGSHLDSQPSAGRFDGSYGVIAAAVAIAALARHAAETGVPPACNFCVVNWTNEEGARFQPSLTGSSVFVGAMPLPQALALRDAAGVTLGAALEEIGFAGAHPVAIPVAAYAEIHVEQGPTLERRRAAIGVVRETWAASKWRVRFDGEQNHTGPTPMAQRRDALLAAAHAIVQVRAEADRHGLEMHSSVGRLDIYPNSPNIVPAQATLLIELRSRDVALLGEAGERLAATLQRIADMTGTQCVVEDRQLREPGKLDAALCDLALDTGLRLRLATENSVTISGHDAINLSRAYPSCLLFVPSRNGVSHNEAEFTSDEDMHRGLRFLTAFLSRLGKETPRHTGNDHGN
ncbi:Zn-dependent hydrolase [Robbsia sp. Bb-Pol-6]|uniref:Zn-dependent hydrolase n=1 Tax=Robbsia betulipollinis TaxID=2981849 RepID=A0ABT3ZJI9_9BURK|nr:Zn-dependent hydrolase [Robbsia betulipollinis]MCY0386148.1 Zn-dependent hydrolase [Robbsia betulipollinis]